MKKSLVFALCVIGFMFIAAPTAVEYHQVFLNGKPFVKARVFHGEAAAAVKEFAMRAGQVITLEPTFSLQGSNLNASISAYSTPATSKVEKQDVSGVKQDVSGVKQNPGDWHKADPAKKAVIKGDSRAMFKVNKPGPISTRVFNADGEMWIPLRDIAAAFKGNLSPNAAAGGTLKSNEAIQLTFTSNPDAILIGM